MTPGEVYEFGEFTLDVAGRQLSRQGRGIDLEPKAYDVLLTLVRNAGRVVTRRELLETVWHDAFVEDGIVSVHISHLRKAPGRFGRRSRSHRYRLQERLSLHREGQSP